MKRQTIYSTNIRKLLTFLIHFPPQVAPIVVEHRAPQPYSFGYSIKDELSQQNRQEESDGVVVRGNYGFADARGIQRQVAYFADDAGFRAEVRTNEPGTANQNPAAVRLISTAPKPVLTPVALVAQAAPIAPVIARDVIVNRGAVLLDKLGYERYGF